MAIGDAEKTITSIDNNQHFQKFIKRSQYRLIRPKKEQLEKELKEL